MAIINQIEGSSLNYGTSGRDKFKLSEGIYEATILGNGGDDLLNIKSNNSSSIFFGGDGTDTIKLPGERKDYSARIIYYYGVEQIEIIDRKTGRGVVRFDDSVENLKFAGQTTGVTKHEYLPGLFEIYVHDRAAAMSNG